MSEPLNVRTGVSIQPSPTFYLGTPNIPAKGAGLGISSVSKVLAPAEFGSPVEQSVSVTQALGSEDGGSLVVQPVLPTQQTLGLTEKPCPPK